MTLIQSTNGPRGADPRSVHRVHQWAKPNETVVENLFEKGHLAQMMRASAEITHGLPIPILSLPQVQICDGLLLPVFQGAGFSSLSDLINEATTGGKAQDLLYSKTGITGVANSSSTLWTAAGNPSAGSAGAALAGGTNCTNATAGAIPQRNATGGDTLHITTVWSMPSVANNTLLLFDRIWHGTAAASTAGAQTVTMTPTRYDTTGSTGTSKGNFATVEVTATLGATAHTWTIQYVDDSGNSAETTAGNVGVSGCIASRLDVAASAMWSANLNTGDMGISDITQFTMGASVTGAGTNIVLGHPLGFIPQPVAQQMVVLDGINSAFNLVQVLDDACLSLFELYKLATTATQYNGWIKLVSG